MRFRTLLVVAAVAAAAPAFAQNKAARPAPQPAPQYAPVTKIDGFENEEISGNLLHPDGDSVTGTKAPKHPLLVRARTTFVPELVKSSLDR